MARLTASMLSPALQTVMAGKGSSVTDLVVLPRVVVTLNRRKQIIGQTYIP